MTSLSPFKHYAVEEATLALGSAQRLIELCSTDIFGMGVKAAGSYS